MERPTSAADLRQNNRNRIYRYLYDATEAVTKQDVARALNLSLPTVSTNLSELMEEKLLSYGEPMASTGGRKPRSISVLAGARFAAGVSVSDNELRFVTIDLKFNELAFEKTALRFSDTDAYYGEVAALFEAFLDKNSLSRQELIGVGVTIPGVVRPDTDLVEFAPTLSIQNATPSGIRSYLKYPSILINDASASGFAEWQHHGGTANMVYLSIERGVGGAILTDGVNYSGDHYRSGEFGHMCIAPGGLLCRCGRRGCLEAYCSTSMISDRLGLSLDEFFNRLDSGDPELAKIWDVYLRRLAQGIVSIRAALDCDVILGGMLTAYITKERLAVLQELVGSMDPFGSDGRYVRLARFASKSACVGAAMHYITEFVNTI